MKTKATIKAEATTIKNETNAGANTADRVGTAIYDVADNYVHNDDMPDMSTYQTTTAAATESTRLEALINTKASQSALNSLTSMVATKASKSVTDDWEGRFNAKIPYVKNTIDVTLDAAQTYYCELDNASSITIDESFTDVDYNIAVFYIAALATMTVQLTNKSISLTQNHFYKLVIMIDNENNTREFIFEGH